MKENKVEITIREERIINKAKILILEFCLGLMEPQIRSGDKK
jgi:hypothetical protein